MSFNITVLCGAAVGAMLFLLPLKEFKNSYFAVSVSTISMLIMAKSLSGALPLFNYLEMFYESEMSVYFKVLVKILGITLLCNVTSDLAMDLGMSSVSGKIEFAGKVAVLLSAMPVFDGLFSQIGSLI